MGSLYPAAGQSNPPSQVPAESPSEPASCIALSPLSVTPRAVKRPCPSVSAPEPAADTRKARAEKNRLFARESRERKRLYTESLEREVAALRVRLARLEKYELIETQRETATLETIHTDPMRLSQFVAQQTEDRTKALLQLSQIMLQISAPAALFDAAAMDSRSGEIGTTQRTAMEVGVQRIKSDVRLMLECQGRILAETRRIWRCVLPQADTVQVADLESRDGVSLQEDRGFWGSTGEVAEDLAGSRDGAADFDFDFGVGKEALD